MPNSGIDLSHLDHTVRPQDDLYRYLNGGWIDEHEIPADRAFDGALRSLRDQAEEFVRDIITEAGEQVAAGLADASSQTGKIGALYSSFMNTELIEELGLAPIAADLDLISQASDRDTLAAALGTLQRTGAAAAAEFWVDNDAKDPEAYIVYLTQAGLGLPDESYYRDQQYSQFRDAYVPHIARMLQLAAVYLDADQALDAANRVVEVETALALHHWDVVRNRDAELTYNQVAFAELVDRAPGFAWDRWVETLGAPAGSMDKLVVRQPTFVEGFAELWQSFSLTHWQDWMRYQVVSTRAPYLPQALVEANFDFYGRALTGAQELRERWKRAVSLVEGALGEAVGAIYVRRHFPASHKDAIDKLVTNLIAAYRQSIKELTWLGEETRDKALAKLEAFTPKIGYPVRWRDYSDLLVDQADLLGNVRRASAWAQDRELEKIGKPLDRDEWFMTPQTVNAYYNPGMNEIVFPAAILQPPMFDPTRDDAANYGGIGAVIGHEIGHGFDDQGSKYDGTGALADWWTTQDRTEFERRTRTLIDQYAGYSPTQLQGSHQVNGALTIGENIGDLGGLTIALRAYEISLGHPVAQGPQVDGLSAAQRVFLSWAQCWRSKGRDEEVVRRLATDPHSPDEFRCNGVVRNIDEFYEAWAVAPGDRLYLKPQDRVRIW